MRRYYQLDVGNSEVIVITDGSTAFPGTLLMVGVEEQERREACEAWKLNPDAVESSMNCIYIKHQGRRVLFDTGAGAAMPGCGLLPESLDDAGISRDSIDQVIHTHLHLDHIGWNVDERGAPMFPNTRYSVGETEWDFWSDDATLTALDNSELWNLPDFEPAMAAPARKNVLAIRDRVDVFPDDGEVAPGVLAMPAYGHTPGHLAFKVELGEVTLYITGDLVLSPFHLDHSRWFPAVDLDPETAIQSRAKVLNHAAESGAMVAGFHLPFPGIGRVGKADDGWEWVEVTSQ